MLYKSCGDDKLYCSDISNAESAAAGSYAEYRQSAPKKRSAVASIEVGPLGTVADDIGM